MEQATLETPITRLRKLSESLDLEEQQVSSFFNLSPDLCAIISVDGLVVRVNKAWRKLLGWENLVDTPWMHLVHPDDETKVRDIVGHLVAHDIPRFHCRMRRQDKQYVVVEFSASKWVNGRSNLIGRVVPDLCINCPEASPRLLRRPHGCDSSDKQGT